MSKKDFCPPPNTMCINTERVYDWVVQESSGSTTISASSLPVALPTGITNVQVSCRLTDAAGQPMPANAIVNVTETSPRENRQLEINGVPVTLQRVTFTKTLYVVLEITGVDPATGMQFLVTSNPATFRFIKTAYLCAPEGTSLVVRVYNFSYIAVINRSVTETITGFGISFTVCQSIQTVTPVTIELWADCCAPRQPLSEQCNRPEVPRVCPNVFPRE